jgi:hypothetical protein
MPELQPSQLLTEIEDVIRTAPVGDFRVGQPDAVGWVGRAGALIKRWDIARFVSFEMSMMTIYSRGSTFPESAMQRVLVILHEARHDLRLNAVGPLSVAVHRGGVFDYFEELRKLLVTARAELLFVDPYIDPEFAARYLPQVPPGVSVRLLTKKGISALMPAVHLASQQLKLSIEVRAASELHDRYVFVDSANGYQSGASFKDGAKLSPTLLSEITDALPAVLATYEAIWSAATPAT